MLKILSKKTSESIYVQAFRYLTAGSIAFCADFTTLYVLKEFFGLHYLIATLFGFLVGVLITYIFSIKWVFNVRKIKNKHIELLLFIGINTIGLLLTSGFMWIFTSCLGLFYLYSKIITTILVFSWNFVAKKTALFSEKK